MYNKAKYAFDKAGGIVAIVLGAMISLSTIYSFITLAETCGALSSTSSAYATALVSTFIGLSIRAVLGIIIIAFGAQTLSAPVYIQGKEKSFWVYNSKGKNITLIILSGILFILGLIVGEFFSSGDISIEVVEILQIAQNVLAISVMLLKILAVSLRGNPNVGGVSDCLADDTTESTAPSSTNTSRAIFSDASPIPEPTRPVNPTYSPRPTTPTPAKKDSVEQQLAELKHLRELGILTEDDYKAAVARVITKYAE